MKITMLPFAKKTAAALALSLVASAPVLAQSQQVLNFYNWSDYIAEDTINKFEKETGIKVNFDVFDSSELLEAKLLAGNSGYDLVVTPATIIKRHIEAGVYLPLDKQQLPNIKHMHQTFMSTAATQDAGNKHAMPYLWGTTGIGINVDMVKKALGEDVPLDSWDLVFKPENMKKLASCGVSFLDTADEVYSVALNYLGKSGNSSNKSDYQKNSETAQLLKEIRPYVKQFNSSAYVNNLANGNICVAVGYSGDVLQAKSRALEVNNGINIEYFIPKEGTSAWIDVLAIPNDAKNSAAAHQFVNFLMRPEIIADITNYVTYANANTSATKLVDPEIARNLAIYPNEDTMKSLFTNGQRTKKINKLITRFWSHLKTGS